MLPNPIETFHRSLLSQRNPSSRARRRASLRRQRSRRFTAGRALPKEFPVDEDDFFTALATVAVVRHQVRVRSAELIYLSVRSSP